jgi:hypothetical protein
MKIGIVAMILALTGGLVNAQSKTTKDVPKNTETKKFIEMIAGSWKLEKIVDAGKNNKETDNNVSGQTNSGKNPSMEKDKKNDQSNNSMQMIEFHPNGRYKLNSSTTSLDSGSYRLNEQHAVLYMESDSDDITPSEWEITLVDKQLTLAGRGESADSRYKYVYKKEKEKVSTN